MTVTVIAQPLSDVRPARRLFLQLQKIHKSTTDLQKLGALKYEETKPTFQSRSAPYHATPQPLATTATLTTKRPKFMVFPVPETRPSGCPTIQGIFGFSLASAVVSESSGRRTDKVGNNRRPIRKHADFRPAAAGRQGLCQRRLDRGGIFQPAPPGRLPIQ